MRVCYQLGFEELELTLRRIRMGDAGVSGTDWGTLTRLSVHRFNSARSYGFDWHACSFLHIWDGNSKRRLNNGPSDGSSKEYDCIKSANRYFPPSFITPIYSLTAPSEAALLPFPIQNGNSQSQVRR